jgi:HEAT repeat protein
VSDRPALARLVADPVPFLNDTDPAIRRLAVAALAGRMDDATGPLVTRRLATDEDPAVRAEAAEALGAWPEASDALMAARDDDPRVVEAVVTALAHLRHEPALPWLLEQATDAADALVREAAVAALGELADERAVPLLIELSRSGPPQVRRRAVVALTVFDGEDVESAIRRAATDRNPMVREAAEMVVGRPEEWQRLELRPGGAQSPSSDRRE